MPAFHRRDDVLQGQTQRRHQPAKPPPPLPCPWVGRRPRTTAPGPPQTLGCSRTRRMDVAKNPKPLPLGEERVGDGETKAWPPSQRQWHPAPRDLSSPQGARSMRRLERQAPKSDDTPWSTPLGDSPQSSRPPRALGTLGVEQRWWSEHGHRPGPTRGAGVRLGRFHGCLGTQSLQGVGVDPPPWPPPGTGPLMGSPVPG